VRAWESETGDGRRGGASLACNHHDDPSCSAHAYSLQSAPPCFPVNSIINASLVILCILFFVCSPRPNNRPVSRSFLVLFVFRVATRFRLHPNSIMVLFAATDEPLIDEDNPLYCPDVSAQQVYFHIHWSSKPTFISIQFLSSVRLFQASVSDSTRFSFYQRLCSVFDDSESKESPSGCSLGVIRSSQTPESIHHAPQSFKFDKHCSLGQSAVPELRHSSGDESTLSSDDFGLLLRPTKRLKRSSSQDNLSFIISARANRLSFTDIAKDSTAPSEEACLQTFDPDLEIEGSLYTIQCL
jgi:hypothetical protein